MIVEVTIIENKILREVSLKDLNLTQEQWDAFSADEKKDKLQYYAEFHFDKAPWEVTNWAEVKF